MAEAGAACAGARRPARALFQHCRQRLKLLLRICDHMLLQTLHNQCANMQLPEADVPVFNPRLCLLMVCQMLSELQGAHLVDCATVVHIQHCKGYLRILQESACV